MFAWFLPGINRLVLAGAFALTVIASLLGFGALERRSGAKTARTDAKQKDLEHAQDIGSRVDAGLADRVRRYDDAGYRD